MVTAMIQAGFIEQRFYNLKLDRNSEKKSDGKKETETEGGEKFKASCDYLKDT